MLFEEPAALVGPRAVTVDDHDETLALGVEFHDDGGPISSSDDGPLAGDRSGPSASNGQSQACGGGLSASARRNPEAERRARSRV
jgi:hypothetical protein